MEYLRVVLTNGDIQTIKKSGGFFVLIACFREGTTRRRRTNTDELLQGPDRCSMERRHKMCRARLDYHQKCGALGLRSSLLLCCFTTDR
ncbi:unnamed protein product [Brassica rapa]|uniref:Uncharacterized protein n=1 Tax=Brassica campestris TaxID=3711 RepID=A0A8D9HUU1_BRACM|nr:unnamed protein product [Brassica rapa]